MLHRELGVVPVEAAGHATGGGEGNDEMLRRLIACVAVGVMSLLDIR